MYGSNNCNLGWSQSAAVILILIIWKTWLLYLLFCCVCTLWQPVWHSCTWHLCRFTNALAGLAVNEIVQRTAGRLESIHSEGVHVWRSLRFYWKIFFHWMDFFWLVVNLIQYLYVLFTETLRNVLFCCVSLTDTW